MKKFLLNSLFLVAAAGFGFANQLPNVTIPSLPSNLPTPDPLTLISELSPQCQAAFLGIVINPEFFQCVPVGALLPVITDPTFLPDFIKDPIGNFPKLVPIIDAICADPKCSDSGVAAALKSVEDGCSSKSDASNPITQLGIAVLTFYSPVRDIICFEDNKKDLCIVDTVNTLTHLPKPPTKLIDGGFIDEVVFGEPKFFCTPCNKAIVNTAINFFNSTPQAIGILENGFHIGPEELLIVKFGLAIKCGFQFEDGKVGDSTTDPNKFSYQVAGANSTGTSNDYGSSNDASSMKGISLMMAGSSLLASTFFMI